MTGMRFCEQDEGRLFRVEHSKSIMIVVASQAAMHIPLYDVTLWLQAMALAPPAGEEGAEPEGASLRCSMTQSPARRHSPVVALHGP